MSSFIPRYLYHLTSKANYKSIVSSGLKISKPESACEGGVFMLELTNFFKRWGVNKNWEGNLQKELLLKVGGNSGEIVMFRVPTKGLDSNKLRVRSQNRLSPVVKLDKARREQILHECAEAQTKYIETELSKLDANTLSVDVFQKKCNAILKKAYKKFPFPENIDEPCVPFSEHIISGSPAKERKLFQQRKEAIEYIYPEDIPASLIEKVGEIDVYETLLSSPEKYSSCSMRNVFSKLLKGTPEEKATLLINA